MGKQKNTRAKKRQKPSVTTISEKTIHEMEVEYVSTQAKYSMVSGRVSIIEHQSREDENPPTGRRSMSPAPGINLNLLPDLSLNSIAPPSQYLSGTRGILSVTLNPTDKRTHFMIKGAEAVSTSPSVQSGPFTSTPVAGGSDYLVANHNTTPAENTPSRHTRERLSMLTDLVPKKSSMAKSDRTSTGKSKGSPVSFSIKPFSPQISQPISFLNEEESDLISQPKELIGTRNNSNPSNGLEVYTGFLMPLLILPSGKTNHYWSW